MKRLILNARSFMDGVYRGITRALAKAWHDMLERDKWRSN